MAVAFPIYERARLFVSGVEVLPWSPGNSEEQSID